MYGPVFDNFVLKAEAFATAVEVRRSNEEGLVWFGLVWFGLVSWRLYFRVLFLSPRSTTVVTDLFARRSFASSAEK